MLSILTEGRTRSTATDGMTLTIANWLTNFVSSKPLLTQCFFNYALTVCSLCNLDKPFFLVCLYSQCPWICKKCVIPSNKRSSSTFWFFFHLFTTVAFMITFNYLSWGNDFSSHLIWAQGAVLQHNKNKYTHICEIRKSKLKACLGGPVGPDLDCLVWQVGVEKKEAFGSQLGKHCKA